MADTVASGLALHERSISLLAHLQELRKRIILSVLGILAGFLLCWSFADRLFGLMQQPIIYALRRHGIGGGLVYLNPTEPFNLYLQVAIFDPCHFCSRRSHHTYRRYPEHVSFRRPDGGALRHQYRRGVAGTFPTQSASRGRLAGVAIPPSVRLP